MANWCYNYISIEGNEELQKEIAEFVRSEKSDFDFKKIVPVPENIYCGSFGAEEEKLYGKNNWYDWSIEHWGTSRNADVRSTSPDFYVLETAWSPCEPVIAELARLFPAARIVHRYEETGVGFCGEDIYQAGTIVYKMQGDYACYWTAKESEKYNEETLKGCEPEDDRSSRLPNGDFCVTTEDGNIYIRKYKNGRLLVKIDGEFEEDRPEGERTYRW